MRTILLIFTLFISVTYSFGSTVYTACDGVWNSPNTWQGGTVPVAGDSIYVNHNVVLTSDLILTNNFLSVSVNSQICGLYELLVDNSSYIVIDGVIKTASVVMNNQMVVNGILYTGQLANSGSIAIYGSVVVGWSGVCTIQHGNAISASACYSYTSPSGDYTWNSSGTYYDTIQSISGCDSIIPVNLTIYNNTSSTIEPTACESYTSPSGNYTWTTSGTYADTIPSAMGCDSIMTINLTIVSNHTSSTFDTTACENYTSPSGNYTWTSSGTYADTIPNSIGCDSVMTINLTIVNNHTSSTIDPTVCDKFTSPSGNYTLDSTGTYMDTIPNAIGCDSVITINLTVNNTSSTIEPTACERYTSPSGNYTWTFSGTYADTIPNAIGCDSIMTINLTLNRTSATINEKVCDVYTSPSGDYTWETSGTYTDTIPNTLDCDSIITINLIVDNCDSLLVIPNVFTPNGDGNNDLFKPILGTNVTSINILIFNRWGKLMYESDQINEAWDGRSKEGNEVTDGNYFYIIEAKMFGEIVKKQGAITLIR